MPDPGPVPDLEAAVEYLRRYGGSYSVEALAEQLREQGLDPAVLAQAVFTYNQEREAGLRPAKGTWQRVAYWTCGVLVTIVVVVVLLVGLCIVFGPKMDFK
jgi:predicted cobalt transporter CbtA